MMRIDWSQSQRSQWFARWALDNNTTNNALVQQGTLPSTGATTHANYQNGVISNTYTFSPSWVGNFTFGASYLHGTADRNQYLGFALAFPFSSTSKTISGFETYGDNSVRYSYHCVPGHSQPGEISVSLRCQRLCRHARPLVWR